MFLDKPQLYDYNIPNEVIMQGDIFPEANFYIGNDLKTIQNVPPNSDLYIGNRMIAIISSTCDIPKAKHLLISPVYSLEEYFRIEREDNPNRAQSNVGFIKSRKGFYEKFYLENLKVSDNKIDDYIIDLKIVNPIDKNLLKSLNKIASLSHWGRQVLNYQLGWLLGRPIVEWT